jgi:hypothetical protein
MAGSPATMPFSVPDGVKHPTGLPLAKIPVAATFAPQVDGVLANWVAFVAVFALPVVLLARVAPVASTSWPELFVPTIVFEIGGTPPWSCAALVADGTGSGRLMVTLPLVPPPLRFVPAVTPVIVPPLELAILPVHPEPAPKLPVGSVKVSVVPPPPPLRITAVML